MADLQGCIPHSWRHTVEHLEDPTAYILQLTPKSQKADIRGIQKKTLSNEKGRFSQFVNYLIILSSRLIK